MSGGSYIRFSDNMNPGVHPTSQQYGKLGNVVVIAKAVTQEKIKLVGIMLAVVGIILLLPRLWQFLQIGTAFIAWPWQFDFTEGVNLNAANSIAHGINIYRHNSPYTFISAPYTPLFYVLNVPVTWLWGPTFGPGRTLSMIGTIVTGIMAAFIVKKATTSWAFGVLAGALYLSLSPVMVWAALYTQSALALTLEVVGMAWVLAFPTGRRTYWSIIFFFLAFFTKQVAIDNAAAVTLWLLIRDFKHGVRYAVALLAAVLAPFGIANLLLKGGLWEHTVSDHMLSWRTDRFWKTMEKFWGENWPLIVGSAGSAVGVLFAPMFARKGERKSIREYLSSPATLVVIYYVIATVTSLARLGRDGSSYNHLLDIMLPECLMVCMALGLLFKELEKRRHDEQQREKEKPNRWAWAAPAALFAAAAWVLVVVQVFTLGDPKSWNRGAWPSPEVDTQFHLISNLVASTPGDIYSEDSYLLLSNGRQVLYDDAFMFGALSRGGKWDESIYNQKLKDRSFSLILLEHGLGRFTVEGRRLFEENYNLLYEDVRDSYVPK